MADLSDVTGALIIRPGDTLILRTTAETREQLNELADHLRAKLPEDVQLVVLGGVEQMAVYRPDGQLASGKPPADTSWLRTPDA